MNKLKYNDSKISSSSSKKINLNNLKTQNPLYKNNKEEKIRKNTQIENKNEIKNEEIVEKKDAFIVLNNEENEEKKENDENNGNNNNEEINKNDINKEETDKNAYLKLTQEEINKLINNVKTKSQINENFFKNNIIINNNKKENKTLKNLIEKQNNLFNDMDKIKLKKKYLNEYSLNNLSKNNKLYKNIQKDTLKNLEQTENNILEKITSINQQIKDINKNKRDNENEDNQKPEEKKEVKKEKKVKNDEKYLPYQKIMKDAEKGMIKKGKEFDKYEKEKNLQKSLEIIEKIKKGKEFEKSRSKKIKLEVVKTRPFINSYNKRNKKNYLYIKMANSFEKKKKELISNSKKNKNSADDKKEFNLNDYLTKKKIESKENTNKLHKLWKERSNILSKYKSSSYFKVLYSDEGFKQREKNRKENIKKLYNDKEKYSKEKIHLPPISNILKREREKEYVLIKKRNILKKNNSNLSNREFKKMLNKEKNLKEKKITKSYSSISINNINKKNGIVNIYGHINKKTLKNPKDFNYLEEIRKERLMNSENSTIDLINNNNKDVDISIIKGHIQLMEEKYKRDKELLKIQGGYAHNHELGDKMNQLLVNSIKNKLDMIENMNI